MKKLVELLKANVNRSYKFVGLAAGTGRFTELIAVQKGDWEVIAVEPYPQMEEVREKCWRRRAWTG